ncbi:DNA-protecting protein DprA, partial [Candidatus Peregrinibacteria bacterium]|nr:DNA-protecting protein DprA [Candidatus Peregrinibacteria bacterium]
FHFPQRNRIISGLSIATLIIEAPEKSGALITAELALEQGREIFVVPGDVDRQNSQGILKLLQDGGAYPVASGQDIIKILNKQPHLFNFSKKTNKQSQKNKKRDSPYKLSPEESEILSVLKIRRSVSIDEIISKTSISTEKLLTVLSFLEIKNLIITKDGKYLRKC